MTHRSALTLVSLSLVSIVASSCGSGTTTPPPPPGPECVALTSYVPKSTAALSFATDIYPILMDPGQPMAASAGCASAQICHGSPPQQLNAHGTPVFQSFLDPPATVLAALMTNSVNAPSMKRVVPGNVGQSFLAYKISGAAGLACVNSSCSSGASVGTSHPCGDPMPTAAVGTLSDTQKNMILDWIAGGALP
jgi:hypothetical protein